MQHKEVKVIEEQVRRFKLRDKNMTDMVCLSGLAGAWADWTHSDDLRLWHGTKSSIVLCLYRPPSVTQLWRKALTL